MFEPQKTLARNQSFLGHQERREETVSDRTVPADENSPDKLRGRELDEENLSCASGGEN